MQVSGKVYVVYAGRQWQPYILRPAAQKHLHVVLSTRFSEGLSLFVRLTLRSKTLKKPHLVHVSRFVESAPGRWPTAPTTRDHLLCAGLPLLCAGLPTPLLCAGLPTPHESAHCCARVSRPRTTSDRRSPRETTRTTAVRGSPDPARRLTTAVRGSPDPARRLTEGLPGKRLALIQGDLRSNPRRGRETRAERFVKRCCAQAPSE